MWVGMEGNRPFRPRLLGCRDSAVFARYRGFQCVCLWRSCSHDSGGAARGLSCESVCACLGFVKKERIMKVWVALRSLERLGTDLQASI